MENKYQIALDDMARDIKVLHGWKAGLSLPPWTLNEHYKTLQELIDLYTNESKYESFAEIHQDHQEEIAKLNSSLDKACELLEKYAPINANKNGNEIIYSFRTMNGWKEYLLKESQDGK